MSTTSRRGRRFGERGQAVPIIAIMTTVLIGFTALMVDLTMQDHGRRSVQNLTDGAALAGARELGATANQTDRISAATAALEMLHTQLWPNQFTSTWVTTTVQNAAGCSSGGSACDVNVVPPSPGNNYSVSIAIPPVNSTLYNGKWGYVEVDLHVTTTNTFSGLMGFKTSTEGARSIAYHFAENQSFGFALYADSVVSTGNDGETVSGNVYANRYIEPQANGKAGFCAANGGYLIFGAPQWPTNYSSSNPGQIDTQPQAYPVKTTNDCATTQAGNVYQTGAKLGNGADCSGAVSGVTFSGTWYGGDSGLQACVADPPIEPPTMESPTVPSPSWASAGTTYCGTSGLSGSNYQPGIYSCTSGTSLTVDHTLNSGLYVIKHDAGNTNCTLKNNCYDLDFRQNASVSGVTFYLEQGATVGIELGAEVTLVPYDNTSTGSPADQGKYNFYSDGNPASGLEVLNGSWLYTRGTMYMPNGTVTVKSNSYIDINPGQAIVGSWNVQSGYHNNPDITYGGDDSAPQREVLKLVQ